MQAKGYQPPDAEDDESKQFNPWLPEKFNEVHDADGDGPTLAHLQRAIDLQHSRKVAAYYSMALRQLAAHPVGASSSSSMRICVRCTCLEPFQVLIYECSERKEWGPCKFEVARGDGLSVLPLEHKSSLDEMD